MKNVLITGCSSGFGYLTALLLARKGYKVWATMRNVLTKNKAKKKELLVIAEKEKLHISVLELDVTIETSVTKAIDFIINEDGTLDYLVNNAGYMFVGLTEAYTIAQAKDQFETNFFGVLRMVKAIAPHMRKQKEGLIVNVTSIAGRLTFPYFGIYCASKHAVEAYSQALRYELAPWGVEVSLVEPGPFGTNLLYSGPKEADQAIFDSYYKQKDEPAALLKFFDGFFQSSEAPNPQLVADDIAMLIETKRGERPERVVSGVGFGAEDYNQKVYPIQQSVVKDALQLQHLMKLTR
ncbi:SDR family NAD(P)-dependent oxidoreductase [Kriegella sp. EG-1]|nr:SDR family NAD(P)-dependent oxidoreductase [Flavobacteriaceae bacterium EG-1]